MKNGEVRISVRNLVEFILRSGDLDTRFVGSSRAVDGTKAHQKVQSLKGDNYQAEVHLKHQCHHKGFMFHVEGRADGIIQDGEVVTIDEIKSTTRPLKAIDENYNHLHWAQAQCYGYIYAIENNTQAIEIQLTYYHLETEATKVIKKSFTLEGLKAFFFELLDKYIVWADYINNWKEKRDKTIADLAFPFEQYRKGQRKLAVAVYRTMMENKKLFAQAPTGIGKTISTVFPAVKGMGEGHTSKIFYLTAKTITRQVAEEAFALLREKGLHFKSLTLTAKDKICFKDEAICTPDACEYAKGHFDRINDALLDILTHEALITRDLVQWYGEKHRVCPFEFSLDLAIWADAVICDYNYVFDPRVYLKRFFMDNNGDYIFLVDEAHNLVDRAREMFSAELYKKPILELRRLMKGKNKEIYNALNGLNTQMLKVKKMCKEGNTYIQEEEPKEIYRPLKRLISESEEWLTKNHDQKEHKPLLELYFACFSFLKIAEDYDERYVTYVEKKGKDVKLKLFCLDPSFLLKEAVKRGRTAVFFSATLTPLDYFRDILGGEEEDYIMKLDSPFKNNNLCLMVANTISTKYRDRESSYDRISDYIKTLISAQKGNYLVFFPSYVYMGKVVESFKIKYPNVEVIVQESDMGEREREAFLERFNQDENQKILGFAVMGGLFSEGIDLKGERLLGAVLVGVGLPQICLERDIIRSYFEKHSRRGFQYAYMYPGMNKVLQGAGRVIRSEEDEGIILLIDERFGHSVYQRLFPRHWRYNTRIRNLNELETNVRRFWSSKKRKEEAPL